MNGFLFFMIQLTTDWTDATDLHRQWSKNYALLFPFNILKTTFIET